MTQRGSPRQLLQGCSRRDSSIKRASNFNRHTKEIPETLWCKRREKKWASISSVGFRSAPFKTGKRSPDSITVRNIAPTTMSFLRSERLGMENGEDPRSYHESKRQNGPWLVNQPLLLRFFSRWGNRADCRRLPLRLVFLYKGLEMVATVLGPAEYPGKSPHPQFALLPGFIEAIFLLPWRDRLPVLAVATLLALSLPGMVT